jgi:hypothetical protein
MKTIEEAARELIAHAHNGDYTNFVQDAFKKGVEFAQQWISVDEELPKEDGAYLVKTTAMYSGYFVAKFTLRHKWYQREVTHWRPIELK